jgi:hypothetical protein
MLLRREEKIKTQHVATMRTPPPHETHLLTSILKTFISIFDHSRA